jgi:hypothetical protein
MINPTLAAMQLTAPHWVWAVVLLLVAGGAIYFYYRRTIPPLRMRVRLPLIILRTIALLALFLALADALWSTILTDVLPLEVVAVVDRSRSMNERDGLEASRLSRAEAVLTTGITERLGERAHVSTVWFDNALYEADAVPESLGTATAIGDALRALKRRPNDNGPPRIAVLLTDGANNRGIDPVDVAAELGYPVISVGFGRPGRVAARVAQVVAPDVVFTDQSFEIDAVVQSGTDSGQVTMRLVIAGRTVDQEQVVLSSPGARIPIQLSGEVDNPGMQALRIDLLDSDGQLITAAGRTVFVQALKGKLKVLLLGFEANWEYASLKRRLSQFPRMDLIDHVVGQRGWGKPLPTPSEWDDLDAAIFLFPSRADLDEYWAPNAAKLSKAGKGVAFVLNERFATPTSSRCPYPLEFCGEVSEHVRGEFISEPASTRQNHPLVRLDPARDWEETRRLWVDRPPWAGVVVFDSVADGVDVLVRTAISPRQTDVPVLWTRALGRGRSLTLTGGPLWRWVADDASVGRAPDAYDAFWRNALQWLTLSDDADRLAIRSERDVYHAGEEIVLEGLVFDEAYRFIDRADVTARIWQDTTGADTVTLHMNPGQGDRFAGRLSGLTAGTYRFDGEATYGGATTDLSGGMLRVEVYGLEEQFSGLDESLLRAIAASSGSGGRYYSEHEALQYLDSLDWTKVIRERPFEFPLGDHWLLLAIFIAALSTEWFVRRRQQLL